MLALDDFPLVEVDNPSSQGSSVSSEGSQHGEHYRPKQSGNVETTFSFPYFSEDDILFEIDRSTTSRMCDLSRFSLVAVPSALALENLTKLTLADNNLQTIPEALFSGTSAARLKELDLSCNCLESLPASLFELPQLTTLLLSRNRLTAFPDCRVAADNLRHLEVEFNCLLTFPCTLFDICAGLECLMLSQNEEMLRSSGAINSERLRGSRLAERCRRNGKSLQLVIDNNPRFLQQMRDEEWEVTMQWVQVSLNKIYPDQVLPFLYVGSIRTVQTSQVYQDLNVRYVLSVGRELVVKVDVGMKHRVVFLSDYPEEDVTRVLDEAFHFINEARDSGAGVIVHCFAGLSRSVSVVAAYLMRFEGMSLESALTLIRNCRPAAEPNKGFLEQLAAYEKCLRCTAPHRSFPSENGKLLRANRPEYAF